MAEGTTSGSRTPGKCVELATTRLRSEDALSTQTLARIELLMAQFSVFVERAYRVRSLDDVRPEMVAAYLSAPRTDGHEPGVSLQHFRRLAVRVLFRTCRALGMVEGDPSLDAALPARSRAEFRPLEDEEVALCRSAASGSLRRIRSAVAWALCEATARTGELPRVSLGDLDLDSGRVWIAGTPRTLPRWGYLSDWGLTQVRRYAEHWTASPIPRWCAGPKTPPWRSLRPSA
jgi:integrase